MAQIAPRLKHNFTRLRTHNELRWLQEDSLPEREARRLAVWEPCHSQCHVNIKAAMQNIIKFQIQLNQSARLNEKRHHHHHHGYPTFITAHLSCLWMCTFSLIFSTSPFFSL